MIIYLKAGGYLREKLHPDQDYYTRRLEAQAGRSLAEILAGLEISPALVAYAVVDEKLRRLDYVPQEGDLITLQPPVAGG